MNSRLDGNLFAKERKSTAWAPWQERWPPHAVEWLSSDVSWRPRGLKGATCDLKWPPLAPEVAFGQRGVGSAIGGSRPCADSEFFNAFHRNVHLSIIAITRKLVTEHVTHSAKMNALLTCCALLSYCAPLTFCALFTFCALLTRKIRIDDVSCRIFLRCARR